MITRFLRLAMAVNFLTNVPTHSSYMNDKTTFVWDKITKEGRIKSNIETPLRESQPDQDERIGIYIFEWMFTSAKRHLRLSGII